jgi:replication initiation protein RepC
VELAFLANEIRSALEFHLNSKNPSANESHCERHIQNSNPESLNESEVAFEQANGKIRTEIGSPGEVEPPQTSSSGIATRPPGITGRPAASKSQENVEYATPMKGYPLGMVLDACPDIVDYAKGGISSWRDFAIAAELVRKMLGIRPSAWEDAQLAMGREAAAVVIAGILQKAETISSAGGYLRNLTERARAGQFSIGPMLMALIRSKHKGGKIRA